MNATTNGMAAKNGKATNGHTINRIAGLISPPRAPLADIYDADRDVRHAVACFSLAADVGLLISSVSRSLMHEDDWFNACDIHNFALATMDLFPPAKPHPEAAVILRDWKSRDSRENIAAINWLYKCAHRGQCLLHAVAFESGPWADSTRRLAGLSTAWEYIVSLLEGEMFRDDAEKYAKKLNAILRRVK